MNKDNVGPEGRTGAPALPTRASPRLDVEAAMQRVQAELARRRGQDPHPDAGAACSVAPVEPGVSRLAGPWRSASRPDVGKRAFVLGELLEGSDQTFVETAYLALLRRPPDLEGLGYFLGKLRSGAMSKVEILGALRWSPEGLAQSVHVDGLMLPYALRRWQRKRFVGPIIAWAHALLRLGALPERQQRADDTAAREAHELGAVLNALARNADERLANVEVQVAQHRQAVDERLAAFPASALEARLDSMASRLEASATKEDLDKRQYALEARLDQIGEAQSASRKDRLATEQSVAQLGSSLEKLSSAHYGALDRLGAMQAHLETLSAFSAETATALKAIATIERQAREWHEQLQADLVGMRSVVTRHEEQLVGHAGLLEVHGALLGPIERAKASEQEIARALDPLYAAFEDKFRGEPALIRARAEPYVRLVLDAGVGSAAAPVLDLGCGRGEWLDVLRERGLTGRGIDSNRVFIDLCRGRGLDVTQGDVIEVMRSLPDGSIGAVTGMHIAEHLPFEVLVRLLDEAHRLLVPGGLLALETPNPENLRVATELFYMDPTHRNPLPPEAFRWLVEARGFANARIERWTVARETDAPPLLDEAIPGAASTNVLLSQLAVAPDYAVVARRGQA